VRVCRSRRATSSLFFVRRGRAGISLSPRHNEGSGAPKGATEFIRACEARRRPCDWTPRLTALHWRLRDGAKLRSNSGPRFLNPRCRRPMQRAPRRAVVMPPGRGPGAARVRGYEPRPQGPRQRASGKSRRPPLQGYGCFHLRRGASPPRPCNRSHHQDASR
jgi:hypothetical protein